MTTIAFGGDSEPTNTTELIKDFNAAFSKSPVSGELNAFFLMGDMTTSSGSMAYTITALNSSSLQDVASYFVIGNHEYDSRSSSYPKIQSEIAAASYTPTYWSGDSSDNTYSVEIGNLHIVVLNLYYNSSTGGVSQAMFDWLSANLAATTKYKVVIAHDPMYPKSKHVGNSLDANKSMRDKLQAMFIQRQVNVFVGGHTHYSSVQNIGGVYHVASGVIGQGANSGEDVFATITYLHINSSGDLILTRKHDSGNSWSNPTVETLTVGTGSTPTPTIRWKCSGAPNYTCTQTTETTGQLYDTEAACQAACHSAAVKKWKCSGAPDYVCVETTDTTGTLYDTQAECQAACSSSLSETWAIGELSLYTEYVIMAKYKDQDSIDTYKTYKKVIKDNSITLKGVAFDMAVNRVRSGRYPKVSGSVDIKYFLNVSINDLVGYVVPQTPINSKYVVTQVTFSQGGKGTFKQTIQLESQ